MSGRGCKSVEFLSHGAVIRARIYGGSEVLLDDVLAEVGGVEKTLDFDAWLATKPADEQRGIRREIEDEARYRAREGAQADREYAADRKSDQDRDDRMTGDL